jgi:hypothetical protein
MRIQAASVLLAGMLAGCASSPPQTGGGFVSAVGTPFLVAFKIPVCITTVALAGPLAGAAALLPNGELLADQYGKRQILHDLDAGLNENCGPPYVIAP